MNRNTFRASAALLAACVLAPAALTAQTLPPAQQIVDRYVQAIGGKDAYRKHTSMRMRATFEMPAMGMRAELMTVQKQPNMSRTIITIPGMGEMHSGFDGNVAWAMDPMQGARILEGVELRQAKDQSQWGAMIRESALIEEMETVERTEVEGTACYQVRIVWKSGREQRDCYAVESGLLIATIAEQESAMGKMEVTSTMEEYREFEGIRVPTRISQSMGAQQAVITVESIEFGNVQAEEIEAPAQIKALAGGN